ncbi:Predicted arabinose efflux permease, MFS family [Ferrithrix thermotolerans DSM 19514]|uniref:Predicted arabinose efflux permease, MFS family n=1 Tax=Ferrithrix thermotolerans DSM 19514 TaxID=1121881 RepID=A0A1M4Y4R6_9ACTN|nr:MFS transporter [Ferrithrix thermotolerans]SHF00698.1 Predicted arabinose efflux permease, MFS family [Ferrithrix thermotolerans DSM 19514]
MHLSAEEMYLLIARLVREVAFGFIAIALPLYWHDSKVPSLDVGFTYTLVLLASAAASMLLGRKIDTIGRRRLLLVSSLLWVLSMPVLLTTHNIAVVAVVAVLATISPTGKEIGLYLAVEQAALSKLVSGHDRTKTYALFNFIGYSATALGAALAAGIGLSQGSSGHFGASLFTWIVLGYTAAGVIQFALYYVLGEDIEVSHLKSATDESPKTSTADAKASYRPSPKVKRIVMTLTALFTLDAFSAGLIVQGLLVFWFRIRFHFDLTQLGALFFGTNILSALSSFAAARLAKVFGLLNTMVFTHLPSNILLILVPLMPNAYLAVAVLLLRHVLSQMDVPTRQAYTMAMVDTGDRSYLASWTNGARSLGTGGSPVLAGALISSASLLSLPFLLSGGLKIVYDLALYAIFRKVPLEYYDTK